MSRTVEFLFDTQELTDLQEATSYAAVNGALGYLSQWCLRFPRVSIYIAGKDELVARYRKEDGSLGYVIGAVWHDDHFGFHS